MGIVRYKRYMNELDTGQGRALSLQEAKPLALAAKQEMLSDPQNIKGILRYVEKGLFPWED